MIHIWNLINSHLFELFMWGIGIAILWVVIAGLFYWKDGEFGGGKGSIKIDYKEDE